MDPLITEPVPPPPHPGRKRLLVMTANTPGFTAAQIAMVERSLADLKAALGKTVGWLAVWRTKEEIKAKLSLTDGLPELAKLPLRKALEAVDAVVTTPSSAQLEAMLAQRPTVLLDYSNSPHYLEAAWCITAHDHIQPTLQALARPEPARLLHQDFILHDALECHTPAAPRMARLIQLMVERFQANGGLSQFPRLLPAESVGCEANPTAPDLHRAYGANPVLTNSDVVDLQRRLVFAQQEIRHLRYSWGLLPVLRKLRSVFRGGGKTQ
jgi:hypothetical protein